MRRVDGLHLWLGTARDARAAAGLYAEDIEVVVDLAAEEPPAVLPRGIAYLRLPLTDDAGGGPPDWLGLAVWTVERLVRDQARTLVACSAGLSRSPAVVAAALARVRGTRAVDEAVRLGRLDLSPAFWHRLVAATADVGYRPTPEGTG